jgi:hypothetical protein
MALQYVWCMVSTGNLMLNSRTVDSRVASHTLHSAHCHWSLVGAQEISEQDS